MIAKSYCFLHEDRLAQGSFKVPCAPDSKLPACNECLAAPVGSQLRQQIFRKYAAAHADNIEQKRRVDEYWRRT
jgi:hypothetical protein